MGGTAHAKENFKHVKNDLKDLKADLKKLGNLSLSTSHVVVKNVSTNATVYGKDLTEHFKHVESDLKDLKAHLKDLAEEIHVTEAEKKEAYEGCEGACGCPSCISQTCVSECE